MMWHEQFRKRGLPWRLVWQVLSSLVALILMFLFIWPWPGCVASPKTQTLAQLKQIGMAASMYAGDHDDRFPPDTSSVRASADALSPYWMDDELTVSRNPGSPEYLGNGSLSAAKGSTINEPGLTVLFFDSAPWAVGRRTTVFVDTSARAISEPEFQKAVANDWRIVRPKP